MNRRAISILALVSALAVPAWADAGRDAAAAAAQRATGGRVLSVEKAGSTYRVKVVTPSGEVRVVVIDAGGRGG